MQLERRKPPLKLNPNSFDETFRLWKQGQAEDKLFSKERGFRETPLKPLKKRSLREYPKSTANLEYLNVPNTTYADTSTKTVYDRILEIKAMAETENRIHHDFWL